MGAIKAAPRMRRRMFSTMTMDIYKNGLCKEKK